MRRGAGIALLVALAGTACDALLVDPGDPAPALRLQVLGTDTTGFASVLAVVDRARLSLERDGMSVDTVVPAQVGGSEARIRAILAPPGRTGPITVTARLMQFSLPLFEGSAVLNPNGASVAGTITLAPVPAFILVGPGLIFDALGDSVELSGVVLFETGDTIFGLAPEWSSDDSGVVEVHGPWAVPRSNGKTTLRASAGGVRRRPLEATVAQSPATFTGIGPDTTVAVGASIRMRAYGTDANGVPLLPGTSVTWSIVSGPLAIAENGTVTATAEGVGTVAGTAHGTTQSATITVIAP